MAVLQDGPPRRVNDEAEPTTRRSRLISKIYIWNRRLLTYKLIGNVTYKMKAENLINIY